MATAPTTSRKRSPADAARGLAGALARPNGGRLAGYLVFVVVLVVLPLAFSRVGGIFTLSNLIVMGLYALPAVGLVLLMGYAGQISIGQAAFYACGGYASAVLTTRSGLPTVAALLVGAAIAAVLAWIVGLALFRTRGHYLAVATLAFGLVVSNIAGQLDVTGGSTGITGIPNLNLGFVRLGSDTSYYIAIAIVLLVAIILADNLVRSSTGRALRAMGDSEVGAASSGVRIRRQKLVVFVAAAVMASVAGSLYANWTSFVDPTGTADLLISLQILVIATLGGLRNVWGAPVGAFLVIALNQLSREVLPQVFPNVGGQFQIVVYGIVLVAVLILLPDGIVGGAGRLARSLLRRGADDGGHGPVAAPALAESAEERRPPREAPDRPMLEVRGLTRRFGGVAAVDDVDLLIPGGGIVGLIGPNGAGKTTFFNMLSGVVAPSDGRILLDGRDVTGQPPERFTRLGVARTFQNLELFSSLSVRENVMVAREVHARSGVLAAFASLPRQHADERSMRNAADRALGRLGIQGLHDVPVTGLAHGERRRVEIARALAGEPELLLLDEPMAGLSHAESTELVQAIEAAAERGITVILVEHYIALVMELCDRVVVMHEGHVLADGPPSEVQNDPSVIEAVLGTADESMPIAGQAKAAVAGS